MLAGPTLRRIRNGNPLALPALAIAAAGGLLLGTDLALWSTGVVLGGATNPTLLAGVFYGGYFLVTQRGRQALDSVTYLGVVTTAATAGLLLLNLALGSSLTGYSPRTYLVFLALGLVPQIGGYLTMSYAFGHFPATVVAPTMLAQPVLTAALALVLLGEPLSLQQGAGGAAVLAGVYVVHRSRSRSLQPRR